MLNYTKLLDSVFLHSSIYEKIYNLADRRRDIGEYRELITSDLNGNVNQYYIGANRQLRLRIGEIDFTNVLITRDILCTYRDLGSNSSDRDIEGDIILRVRDGILYDVTQTAIYSRNSAIRLSRQAEWRDKLHPTLPVDNNKKQNTHILTNLADKLIKFFS